MNNTIKEYPILFSTPMVQANHTGRKRMTRRVVKFPKAFLGGEAVEPDNLHVEYIAEGGHSGPGFYVCFYVYFDGYASEGWEFLRCPYGVPGDRLWVRETWQVRDSRKPDVITYRADDDMTCAPWKPSIFMPRAICRDVYTNTSVRVERLHDISEADAIAEGVEVVGRDHAGNLRYRNYLVENDTNDPLVKPIIVAENAIDSYNSLWVKLNGIDSWEANPWVWVVEYDNPLWKGGA